jgi:hypothetical protein
MTIDERNDLRRKIVAKCGVDYLIPEATRDAIHAYVRQWWHIRAEDFTGHRLSFDVMPRGNSGQTMRAEAYLSRTFGNPPHTLATDFSTYRLTFTCN